MSSYEQRIYNDRAKQYDAKSIEHYNAQGIRGIVEFRDPTTGEILFRKKNKVILAGSIFTACKHFDIEPTVSLPNYNTELGLDQTVETAAENVSKICLFAVGIDGCGAEDTQIIDVNYMKWLDKDNIVPFVYRSASDDLSDEERKKYFGRKTIAEGNKVAYYFKAFEADPEMVIQYVDGTPIDNNVYTSKNTTAGEVYVVNRLRITPEDCREFFKATSGLNKAKVNTITLLQAWKKEIEGKIYYQNIQPVTKLNFGNEHLIDESKGLDITYYLYY